MIGLEALETVAGDIVEEQGLGPEPERLPDPGLGSLPPPPAASGELDRRDTEDNRLAAVEQSVSSLADALREELALLRQTLTERDKPH